MSRLGALSSSSTRRSGAANGSGRSSTPLARVNTAVVAPMPTASTRTTGMVSAGVLRSTRAAWRRSSISMRACSRGAVVKRSVSRSDQSATSARAPAPAAWRSWTSATISLSYSCRNAAGYKRVRRRYQRTERVSRVSRMGSRALRRKTGDPCLGEQPPQALGFRDSRTPPVRGDAIEAAALVCRGLRAAHLVDEALLQHPLDRAVERAGAEADPPVGQRGDFLHHAVAVTLVVGQGD